MIGAAGAGRPTEQRELRAALAAHGLAHRLEVVGDGEIALAAGFGTGAGILVSAGTGSVAYARDDQGRLRRSGGYGWQLGDEGGGYWIGRRALAAAARAHDRRGEGTTLLARLLAALGLRSFDDLVRWAATATPAQVAGVAPHLLNAAQEGEAVAQRVVDQAARELVELVRLLEPAFPPDQKLVVATAGGLLTPGSPLSTAFREALRLTLPRASVREHPVDTLLGALRLAAELQ